MAGNSLDHIRETCARLDERSTIMLNDLNLIKSALCGDGSEDKPGLLKDVDRLKQSEKRRMKILGAFFTTSIGLVGERLWAFFSTRP